MRVRWGIAAAAAVVLSGALAGCGPDGGTDGPADAPGGAAGMTSTDPVSTDPLVWEADGVVHLSDGTEVELGGLPSSYVVAGDGVFFVPAASEDDAEVGSVASADVRFADVDGDTSDTGLRVRADTLRASPDGRYVVGIDVESGDEDAYGTPLAEVVVLDLRGGREAARTSQGLGDTDDDLADLYEDAEIGVAAITDETAYVDGVDTTLAIDLATGEVTDAGEAQVPVPGAPESPDGAWTIRQDGDRGTVLGEDGKAVPLDVPTPQWTLDWWADAQTVVGVAVDADGTSALLSCLVPQGTCEVHEASTGAMVRFATGATDELVVRLLGGEG
ncbi:hypothetical protein [Nocardioides sp.]|uniref:hypothetical protein n=1 Tax=Nocardioides sp. TaxID=35761 RepID=UPI0026297BA0|nr:hypothetical protein [Nocardioides sp.]MCW2736274.1 hypothetical protein [Nocardioides sp.]